jgi:DNA-binding beta-propeller fold protein YncE
MLKTFVASLLAASCLAAPAFAQIAVSSNDHKMQQANGVTSTIHYPPVDTITILDLGVSPVRVVGTVNDVPGSVVGPPSSVVVTADESMALIASSTQIDPGDRTKTIPEDRVTAVDLKDRKILGKVFTGPGAAGMSINKAGNRVYVCNRMAGSISILEVAGKNVKVLKTVPITTDKALLSHVALSPDGLTAVATRNGDAKIEILKINGDNIWSAGTLDVAPRPYSVSITPDGKTAVVASLGAPEGNGILTVVDLTDPAGKILGTVDTGYENLEGMMMSQDGKWVAGVLHAGSTRPDAHPKRKPNGMLVMYRLDGTKLTKTGEAALGAWSQGASFSKDGTTVVAQNMIERDIWVFRNDNGKLTNTGQKIPVSGGAAAIRASTDR